jgi:DNA polymerase I-like protein with 3'-5' exonuclease and polymerase domains
VLVPLGEVALKTITGKSSIEKWKLSILEGPQAKKIIPIQHPSAILRKYEDYPFLAFGVQRVVEESRNPGLRRIDREFITQPPFPEALEHLKTLTQAEELSVDIETSQGQITCIGFASSPRYAVCIPTRQQDYSQEQFYELWRAIRQLLAGPARKILQNGIYDLTYLSAYGIRVRNFFTGGGVDTMLLQKFLFPELPKGLDTIARLYTREPYWKDDGKDWGLANNVEQLYRYNCLDCTGTQEASQGQRADLKKLGSFQESFFSDYIMRLGLIAFEMSTRGLPVDLEERSRLKTEAEAEIKGLRSKLDSENDRLLGKPTNPRSPIQVKALLKAAGYRIPTKLGRESTDRESLLKLRQKDQESKILTPLIQLSEKQKALSSYLECELRPDGRLPYTIQASTTETGRWAAYKDPWGRGLNVQTIPKKLKSQFLAPKGWRFVEIDLAQADARVVAWLAPEPTMIEFFRSGKDLHRFVAAGLFGKPEDQIEYLERQLGKKVGHGANYGEGEWTLSNQCLKEMDLVLPVVRAREMLERRHRMFPGIPKWHLNVQRELGRTRQLTTPLGRVRRFYGRMDDRTFKQAYAHIPQSTVSDVISLLACHLFGRTQLLAQIHDSILCLHPAFKIRELKELVADQDAWNPELDLPGGKLRIPVEIEVGERWSEMEEIYAG